jgi:caffeoyl-CoA O-methyltransferase
MIQIVPEKLEAYAEAHSEPVAPVFEELRKETYANVPSAQMQVGRLEGDFLRLLVRLVRARRVLEIGMFTGYSGLMMAEGLPDDGELITCDVDTNVEKVARRYFAKSPHGKKIQIRMGPALETLKALEGPFDFVFIDADKTNYSAYYDAVFPKVRTGGLIVADNTLWSGDVLDPKDADARAIVAFNAKVAADSRVEKVLVTVRDGMMLAYKK